MGFNSGFKGLRNTYVQVLLVCVCVVSQLLLVTVITVIANTPFLQSFIAAGRQILSLFQRTQHFQDYKKVWKNLISNGMHSLNSPSLFGAFSTVLPPLQLYLGVLSDFKKLMFLGLVSGSS